MQSSNSQHNNTVCYRYQLLSAVNKQNYFDYRLDRFIIKEVTNCIVNYPNQKDGFIILGYSQGGYLLRSYLENRTASQPKVLRFITLTSPLAGYFCGVKSACAMIPGLPDFVNELIADFEYTDFVQNLTTGAGYWRNPYQLPAYLDYQTHLSLLDNQAVFNYILRTRRLSRSRSRRGLRWTCEGLRRLFWNVLERIVIIVYSITRIIFFICSNIVHEGHYIFQYITSQDVVKNIDQKYIVIVKQSKQQSHIDKYNVRWQSRVYISLQMLIMVSRDLKTKMMNIGITEKEAQFFVFLLYMSLVCKGINNQTPHTIIHYHYTLNWIISIVAYFKSVFVSKLKTTQDTTSK
ncbi:Palmitoyl-protein_thioesterase [Hexamita inflata]|uniref:Palmitoyl-protein_thioesterase n=1 Tax=Hexamita inflata TaxID=28002 RepID=A0ABP1J196_9EUKA